MIFTEDVIEKFKQGLIGEGIFRDFLSKRKIKFMQLDILWEYEGKWYVGEIKAQEKFTKGFGFPFDGHGLPPYQMQKRIEFGKAKDIIPVFIVYDINDECIYWQFFEYLDSLPDDKKRLTKTKKRIIFDISCFNKILKL